MYHVAMKTWFLQKYTEPENKFFFIYVRDVDSSHRGLPQRYTKLRGGS